MQSNIQFKKAKNEDLDKIMQVIAEAQKSLKNQAVDQWQNNYPSKDVILNDIDNDNFYILKTKNNIVAISALIFEEDKTYKNIYRGSWINNKAYATIHRIAVATDFKNQNIASNLLKKLEKLAKEKAVLSLRIDTHRDNVIMQKFLNKNKFKYCGLIYLEDGSERLAYEKMLTL